MAFSVGIGLTNACNLACAHCYRPTDRMDYVPLEQIRVDLAYQDLPVVVIGVGGGLSYSALGATHHTMEDVAIAGVCAASSPPVSALESMRTQSSSASRKPRSMTFANSRTLPHQVWPSSRRIESASMRRGPPPCCSTSRPRKLSARTRTSPWRSRSGGRCTGTIARRKNKSLRN